jgi:hypothetical protein
MQWAIMKRISGVPLGKLLPGNEDTMKMATAQTTARTAATIRPVLLGLSLNPLGGI